MKPLMEKNVFVSLITTILVVLAKSVQKILNLVLFLDNVSVLVDKPLMKDFRNVYLFVPNSKS